MEWGHLDATTIDAMGVLMEKALMYQKHAQLAEAATSYRQVLAQAPNTHDALHMLGVIEYEFRNFDSALGLITDAIKLRPSYAAIDTNLALVRAALVERPRASEEDLAACALPALVDLVGYREGRLRTAVRSAVDASKLHLLGRIAGEHDDDAWLLSRLSQILAPCAPVVWAADDVPGAAPHGSRWRSIDFNAGSFPKGGTQVFVGVNFEVGDWIGQSRPDRLVVVCTRGRPTTLVDQLRTVSQNGQRQIELVFMSPARGSRFGLGHATMPLPIEPLPMLLEHVSSPPESATAADTAVRGWRCGMIGQATDQVEDPSDAQILSDVAASAGTLVLYDPARYRFLVGASATIRFVDRRERSLIEFLTEIDCLYCRPVRWWDEGLGREVLLAMALGKIVVCPVSATCAHFISDGVDGFLYETHDQSIAILDSIRVNAKRAKAVADAARSRARGLIDLAQEPASYAVISELTTASKASNANA